MPPSTVPRSSIRIIRLDQAVPSCTTPYTFESCMARWALDITVGAISTPAPHAKPECPDWVFVLSSQAQAEPEAEQPEPEPARQSKAVMSVSAMLNPQEEKAKQDTPSSSRPSTSSSTQASAQSSGLIPLATDNHDAGIPTPPSEISPEITPKPVKGYVWFPQYHGQTWTDPRI